MIIEHNGKRIAFGMQWKPRLTEGDIHRDARAAKSRYFWHADKAFYYGVLPESDAKAKLNAPLYSGAIALSQRYPDVPNLLLVLSIPSGGFIVCGLHQGRPRHGSDAIVQTEVEVSEMAHEFKVICGSSSFKLLGNVPLAGIQNATMDDVLIGAEQPAILRKTQSALVNPTVFLVAAAVVVGAGVYAFQSYTAYKRAEAVRAAAAMQKNSQQLYTEELAARRNDSALLAKDVVTALAHIRALTFSVGGWTRTKGTCNIPREKQMVCTFDFSRRSGSNATFESFVAATNEFDNVEFVNEAIVATKVFTTLPFVATGAAIDAAKTQREETIEFGSDLQRLSHLGKSTRGGFQPFALPTGAQVAELTSPPISSASWEFSAPFRTMKQLAGFPAYATITQLIVTFSNVPNYAPDQSLAMVTVAGHIFSKPN